MDDKWFKYFLAAYRRLHRMLSGSQAMTQLGVDDEIMSGPPPDESTDLPKDLITSSSVAESYPITNDQQSDFDLTVSAWTQNQITLTEIDSELDQAKKAFLFLSRTNTRRKDDDRRRIEIEPNELPPLNQRIKKLSDIMDIEKAKPKTAANFVVCYDISDNRVRTKLAHYLEEKGFQRIQKSVFIGQIERASMQIVKETLARMSGVFIPTDSIIIVPLGEEELRKMNVLGNEIDMTYALGRLHTLFF